ncbi:MAG: M10 family metallopeptidase C-terminal domain-containing protein [Rhodospirillales bacterium]|nr:M10 family metallopeptidase C-terminal domain-containing protein [Alphaproteobacteria bacterium]MCB9976137.1 M10 family metallopeptidase C-terminal domain-containing protein [Rhodospirillales bacterium]
MTNWNSLQDSAHNSEWAGNSVNYTFLGKIVNGSYYLAPSYYYTGSNWASWVDNLVDTNHNIKSIEEYQKYAIYYLLEDTSSSKIQDSGSVLYTNETYFRASFPDIIDFSFSEQDQASSGGAVGEITFLAADVKNISGNDAEGVTAELPTNFGLDGDITEKGDIFIDYTLSNNSETKTYLGGKGFFNLLHELGHAFGGLKDILQGDSLYETEYNSEKYTIMSGFAALDMKDQSNNLFVRAHGLQLYDIAAIQDTYGSRNYSTRAADDIYTVDAMNPGSLITSPFLYTIWDGQGKDKIDASSLSIAAQIDLRQGRFSSIGYDIHGNALRWDDQAITGQTDAKQNDTDPGNVAIAYHTIIENATGTNDTSKGDILIGNDWSNDLRGLMGNDTLYGDGWVYDGSGGFSDVDLDNPDGQKPLLDNDILRGGVGADVAYGGYGHDIFVGYGPSSGLEGDYYHGGGYVGGPTGGVQINANVDGSDTVDYSGITSYGLTIDLFIGYAEKAGGGDTPDNLISIENVIGSTMADEITGDDDDSILVGMAGNDIFYGSLGKDIYHGGYDSTDLVDQDFINKGDLVSLLRQNDGSDTVDYTNLTDVYFDITILDAALGNYWVDKYYGNGVFNGPHERDTLFSIEDIQVAAGAARQVGGSAVYGTGGYDGMNYSYYGGYNVAHNYYAYGGNDAITAGFKNDFLDGGLGNDTLVGNKGNDTYYYRLGDGQDLIKDLGTQGDLDVLMFDESILPSEVELGRYYGGNMQITFVDDTYIVVYAQNSPYGIDFIKFADGTVWDMQGTLVPVYGTEGNDNLHGTDDTPYREGSLIHDLIYAYGGNDYVDGDTGNDTIYGGDGNDNLNGNYGDDLIYGEDGNDTINGGHNEDILYGGEGDDTLNGGVDIASDILYGDAGDDTLDGGPGNDILYGGSGHDSLKGSNGSDTFVFEASSAFDNIDDIVDFNVTIHNDKIDISDILSGFYEYGVDAITDFVLITTSGSDSLLSVDQDGGADNFIQIATLHNITGLTDEAALEASGNLITA